MFSGEGCLNCAMWLAVKILSGGAILVSSFSEPSSRGATAGGRICLLLRGKGLKTMFSSSSKFKVASSTTGPDTTTGLLFATESSASSAT